MAQPSARSSRQTKPACIEQLSEPACGDAELDAAWKAALGLGGHQLGTGGHLVPSVFLPADCQLRDGFATA
jgi:hypothetical protein